MAMWLCSRPLGGPLFEELPEVTDVLHLLQLFFGQLDLVLVLDGRDQLDQVERVRSQVAGEAHVQLYLLRLHAEDLRGQLLQLSEVEFTHLSFSQCPGWRCGRQTRRSSRSPRRPWPGGLGWGRSRGRSQGPDCRG